MSMKSSYFWTFVIVVNPCMPVQMAPLAGKVANITDIVIIGKAWNSNLQNFIFGSVYVDWGYLPSFIVILN